MLPHLFSNCPQPDRSKVVDSEPGVLWIIQWEHPRTSRLDLFISESLLQDLETHRFLHLCKHDLDKDTAT